MAFGGRRQAKKMVFRQIACKPLLAGISKDWVFHCVKFFLYTTKKSFKNVFPIKLSYLYLQSEGKKIHCFFSISFVCLFITLFYVPILLNMSIESFPALQECSRRLFWCFRKFRKLPDDCFGTFGISETFPTAVLAFSEIPKRSRRSF